MSVELEAAGAASLGGVTSKQNADLSGQPCRNCGEVVEQRYCTKCGQLAASFHRPIWTLISETVTDTLALDGRLARTLPILFLRPGKLTKNYTEGQRARYVPPFRLFLLASLLFYLALFSVIAGGKWLGNVKINDGSGQMKPITESRFADEIVDETGEIDREALRELINRETDANLSEGDTDFMVTAGRVVEDPRLFFAELEKWGPRLSFLLVPITILALTILHAWRRKIFVYHHAIHALHLHTWIYLAGTLLIVAAPIIGGTAGWIFGLGMLLYTWLSLKTVGETGYFISLLRLFLMQFIWIVSVAAIVLAAIIISGLNASTPTS